MTTTTNLGITSANFDPVSGEMTCFVTPASPLYIYELIIQSYVGLGAPVGLLRPGTAQRPVLRTIFVDSADPVFTTSAPFTLAVTYDNTYHLTAIQVVQGFALAGQTPHYDPLTDLSPEQASLFVTRVLEAAVALFKSPSQPPAAPSGAMASAYNESARARGNGHDRRA